MTHRTLITGGAGFIGSSLVRKLLENGHEVLAIDNLINGKVENLPTDPGLRFEEVDLTDPDALRNVADFEAELVVHLAAHHFIPYCNEHPSETIRVNTYGTQNVFEHIAARPSVRKVVFASTAAVYVPSDDLHREDSEIGAIDIYGYSKIFGEKLLDFLAHKTGKKCVTARFFNAIGPRETNPHLFPDILDQLIEGKDEIHLGNLVPVRDYIYVDDMADGLVTLLENDAAEGPYNIGSGEGYTPVEVVNAMKEILGRELIIRSVPERQRGGDRPYLVADCSRLKALGWECRHDFQSAVRDTLKYYNLLASISTDLS
jgi:UDP-glucose 4-epimerase